MRDHHPATTRRRFVGVLGAAAASVTLLRLTPVDAAEMPQLSPDDATAKALGYVHETAVDGQQCNNCNFWQGGDAEWGGCPLFPGKGVSARGWCKSWIKKA